MERPICGDCPTCLRRTNKIVLGAFARTHVRLSFKPLNSDAMIPMPAPNAAVLERHARRFGPAGVAEVAAEHGLTVDLSGAATIERRAKRGRRRGSLPTQVAELLDRGSSVDSIAEALDLSPNRARKLVNDALAKAAAVTP